ncbi:MAG: bifunctional folylpolyglutamate synthase/dihydrofolate synthase [Bacteroidales bacterium]|nr:bifunctional folylpolyglutamate synthase/dihydrofolate synthase [Bacteroidales bacterium]
MDYTSLIEGIFRRYPMYHKIGSGAYKSGLENIEELLAAIGNPERRLRTVHVAGTNGKGSVAHLLASYCKESGLKTGLFTSPHLVDFRERIRVDGVYIQEKEVLDFFECYDEKISHIEPSFFEITTALAFDYFARSGVDIAVIEVGLGGRLDSTNVITPLLSVITNISLEHTALLGDTISKIAFEKAGIIKPAVPVVVGEYNEESYPVFERVAREKAAPLILAENACSAHFIGDENICGKYRLITIKHESLPCFEYVKSPLCGAYQEKNIATFAAAAVQLSGIIGVSADNIKPAIENLQDNFPLLGRWQVVKESPLTICDTGHNYGCFSETMAQLKSLRYKKLHFIVGFVDDKNTDMIFPLMPSDAAYYVCAATIDRALPSSLLAAKMNSAGFAADDCGDVANAYNKAVASADEEDVIFIGGSTFVVADFLKVLSC